MADAPMNSDGDMKVLDLALRGRWNLAVERARKHPEELALTAGVDAPGMNAVHLAVLNDAPEYLLSDMLQVDGVHVRHACLTKADFPGMTPLMLAAKEFKGIPIFETLVRACPFAVAERDDYEQNALHYLCSNCHEGNYNRIRRTLARAEVLLQADPSVAGAQDDSGRTPIHLLCERYESQMNQCFDEFDRPVTIRQLDVVGFWLFIDIMLQCAVNAAGNDIHWYGGGNPIHLILCLPDPPISLIHFACRHKNIKQEDESAHDNCGNTSLHLAVLKKLDCIAEHLVRRFPNWASVLNNNNQSAFQLAVQSFSSVNSAVFHIAAANPSFLLETVSDDRLLAALLPALSNCGGSTAVFDILRRRPSLLENSYR
jgi:hypothetical protein